MDPQNRVSNHSRSPQDQEVSRKVAAEKQASTPPKANKHKPKNSDEDDAEPQNEPRTFSNSQTTVPVLPLHRRPAEGPAASSQGPAASAYSGDEVSGYSDEYSAQSQDSGRTVLYPDLYVLINDAAGSFCFVTTKNGAQQDICNLTSVPCVQRSLYLNELTDDFGSIKVEVPEGFDGRTRDVLERCMATCGKAAGMKAKTRSRARKESSAQRVRGYYKQCAEAKHFEYKSWVDNEVFDFVVSRKVMPQSYVIGRWMFTIKTEKQVNFLKVKARCVLRCFQDKQKEYQQTDSPASTWPEFRMSCKMAASKSWNIFTMILRQLSFKDSLMVWIVMLCVKCHQKQVILLTLLQD